MPTATRVSDDCRSDRLAQLHGDADVTECRATTAKLWTVSVLLILKHSKTKNVAKIVLF